MIGDSRYRIEEEIARGGMGVVLRVRDGDLDRTLAMKRMKSAPNETMGGSEAGRFARFMEEAQVTAQLDHPAIVPVHDLGFDDDGTGWYTMKLVEGRELGQVFDLAREGKDGWNEAGVLRILVRVCEALAYAHGKGVLHRDLKPANVMVGEFGEVYVMDWGLARVAGSEVTSPREDDEIKGGGMSTLDGSVMGTPEFMAPEQARGEEADERSDVYAVGAMMYHFLAGRPPFQGEAKEVVKMVASEEPEKVRGIPELVAICGKAMEREREGRFASMTELGREVQRYLEGRVVESYESGWWAEGKKLVMRNKALTAALTGVFLALVGMLVLQGMAKREVEESRGEMVKALERMAVGQGLNAGKDLDYGKAAYWFHKAEEWTTDETRAATHRVRARIAEERQTEPVAALMVPFLDQGHRLMEFSPDGKFLKITHNLNQEVEQVVEVAEEKLVESAEGGVIFEAVGFCKATGRVALVSQEEPRSCEVFVPGKREAGMRVALDEQGVKIGAVAFSNDGKRLFLGAEEGRVFDFEKGEFEETIYEHVEGRRIGFAVFDPTGERVMTVTHKKTVEGEEYSGLRVFEVGGNGAALFPAKETWFWLNLSRPVFMNEGREIVFVADPSRTEKISARTGEVILRANRAAGEVDRESGLLLKGGGDFLLTGGTGVIDEMLGEPRFRPGQGTVIANRPWLREVSLRDGKTVRPVGLNRYEVPHVAVSHDGMLVAGWETSGLMRFWSLAESEWDFEMKGRGPHDEVVFSQDGKWMVGANGDGLQVREVESGRKVGAALEFESEVLDVRFSPGGGDLAVGLAGKQVKFWNWKTGVRTAEGKGLPGEVLVSEFSREGDWLAVVCRGGEVVSVERKTGEVETLMKLDKVREKVAAPHSLKGLAFSESGRWLVGWSWCEGVWVWDCEEGSQGKLPPVKAGRFVELMEVRGERLVFLEKDNWDQVFEVKEWDLASGKWTQGAIDAGRGAYSNLDVSDDGSRILLSRLGEEFASLALRDEAGEWSWQKVVGLGRGASFFVPGTPFAVGVTSSGPSRFAMVDLRDGSELAAPLLSGGSIYRYPRISPDGRRLVAVDWSGSGMGRVWDFSVLDENDEKEFDPKERVRMSELNAGGCDGEIGWEELKGEDWLRQWRDFQRSFPE